MPAQLRQDSPARTGVMWPATTLGLQETTPTPETTAGTAPRPGCGAGRQMTKHHRAPMNASTEIFPFVMIKVSSLNVIERITEQIF